MKSTPRVLASLDGSAAPGNANPQSSKPWSTLTQLSLLRPLTEFHPSAQVHSMQSMRKKLEQVPRALRAAGCAMLPWGWATLTAPLCAFSS